MHTQSERKDANNAGHDAGNTAGFNDCGSGLPNNGGNININVVPKSVCCLRYRVRCWLQYEIQARVQTRIY